MRKRLTENCCCPSLIFKHKFCLIIQISFLKDFHDMFLICQILLIRLIASLEVSNAQHHKLVETVFRQIIFCKSFEPNTALLSFCQC